MSAPVRLGDYLEQFALRLVQDAASEAASAYWLRRAEIFDAVGNARCREIAQACRNKAEFLRMYPAFTEADVADALREAV